MKNLKKIKFSEPAYYTIFVQGRLSPALFDSYKEMKIIDSKTNDSITITTIAGTIKDQAQLSGIMNTLYDWGIPILSIECEGPF